MRILNRLLLVVALVLLACPAFAGAKDPLFINLTSDDSHRALMAISFGQGQMERGHPLTVYLNDKAVLVASKKNAAQFAEEQKLLSGIAAKGGTVLVCPMCSKKFGVAEADFITGAKLTSPDITGPALFKDNTKTLSW
ncbi:MAG: DsrE family protein [Humidesulfovibrio sp.]|jgi:sulfur relay (sulfurtransferase) complex TusBCD TusD component (DsrE family)|uniref:DsrE family protein n=1 Tax=Humidesulfovibrio sp. TaxID=2910988 RepID=UPI0027F3848D|nr:DsrE family protein [Humidesulfovibrio sp.]MDQ7835562.1 DsrE family protein [Humidesulfovibrio sp.]